MKLDDWTKKHLHAWLEHYAPIDFSEIEDQEDKIISFLESLPEDDYNDWMNNRGWTKVFEQVNS